MSITPEQFLDFAEKELRDSPAEFEFRNSASRAYYSAFHCCLAEKQRCPGLNESDILGSHDRLYARFGQLSVDDPVNVKLKTMAYMAQMMKGVRHEADYRIREDFPEESARQQIRDAKTVLKHWKQIPKT